MTAATVVVEQVNTKKVNTRFGEKSTYSFKGSDGIWYSTGFKAPSFKQGDTITFEYSAGKYGNDVDLGSVEQAKMSATPTPTNSARVPYTAPSGGKGVFPIPALDGQRAIVRQNALTNARELMVGILGVTDTWNKKEPVWKDRQNQFDVLSAEVIRLAKKFEAYACGDTDLEEVKAEMEKSSG